jgi:hypothetical protein
MDRLPRVVAVVTRMSLWRGRLGGPPQKAVPTKAGEPKSTARNGCATRGKKVALGMGGEEADYVVVHYVGEEGEEEDQADLDEALFEGEAEIAAADAFHG